MRFWIRPVILAAVFLVMASAVVLAQGGPTPDWTRIFGSAGHTEGEGVATDGWRSCFAVRIPLLENH